ncbi:hypothetical protein Hanom_Chr14g01249601 [Helianthus anomalus]
MADNSVYQQVPKADEHCESVTVVKVESTVVLLPECEEEKKETNFSSVSFHIWFQQNISTYRN